MESIILQDNSDVPVSSGLGEGLEMATVRGVRHQYENKRNQDVVTIGRVTNRLLLGVADGVGGAPKGAEASKIALETLVRKYERTPLDVAIECNTELRIQLGKSRLFPNMPFPATTIAWADIKGQEVTVSNLGDSRIYVLDPNGRMVYVSIDHTHQNDEFINKNNLHFADPKVRRFQDSSTNYMNRTKGITGFLTPKQNVIPDKIRTYKVTVPVGSVVIATTDLCTSLLTESDIQDFIMTNGPIGAATGLLEEAIKRDTEPKLTFNFSDGQYTVHNRKPIIDDGTVAVAVVQSS